MDGSTLGLIGGIAGGVLGVIGGLVGTYFSIKNTNGSRERTFMIRAASMAWVMISAYVAAGFLVPAARPWLGIPYGILMTFGIRYMNKRQTALRQEDEAPN